MVSIDDIKTELVIVETPKPPEGGPTDSAADPQDKLVELIRRVRHHDRQRQLRREAD